MFTPGKAIVEAMVLNALFEGKSFPMEDDCADLTRIGALNVLTIWKSNKRSIWQAGILSPYNTHKFLRWTLENCFRSFA